MGWLKHFFDKLKKAISVFSKQPSGKNDGAVMSTLEKAPDFLVKVLLEEDQTTPAAEKEFHFRKLLLVTGNHFWQGGRDDGKIGQSRTPIGEIARTHAFLVQDEIRSGYAGKLEQMDTEIKLKKIVYENAKQDYEVNDKYHKSVNEHYRKNPRAFSRGVAVFYLVIAILLTFADIPLALKLTQTGFDLDLGQNFQIQQLFQNPWRVFQENWEVFILAFGVAFCTVAIKIFYDEFIERPLARTVTQFKNLEGVESPAEVKKVKRVHRARLGIKIMVLALNLATIVMLGRFRYETIKYQNLLEEISAAQNTDFEQFSETAEPNSTSINRADSSNAQVSLERGEETRRFVTESTFILMTILFPVIGGICASLGLNYWGNRRELKVSRDFCETSKKAYLSASEHLEVTVKKKSNLEGILRWCANENFVDNIRTLLLNYYDHGYQRGMLEPDPANVGKDLFTRAEELRNSLITRCIIPQIYSLRKPMAPFRTLP